MLNSKQQAEQSTALLNDMLNRIPGSCHLKVHICYYLAVPEGWGFKDRINEDYHIVFIKGGEGGYRVASSSVPFQKGKIIFVSRGMLHSAFQNSDSPPCIIPIRFGVYHNLSNEPADLGLHPSSFAFIPHDRIELQQLFEKLYRYYAEGGVHSSALCGAVLSEILIRCRIELAGESPSIEWDARVEKVKRQIDEAPLTRHTSSQLAESAKLSEKYFRKIFRKQYGLTPTEYQTKIRMEYARFLLSESGQSVKQVALSLGYPDPYSFSKQFKQWMGYPPLHLKVRK
jgi:AraC-like DNA-binding protein